MELWKPVVGYEGRYEVSDEGNVRSLDRIVRTGIKHNETRIWRGRQLKRSLKHTGYYSVDLCKDGKIRSESVHRLVAEAFIPNPEHKKVVNHINGNKADDRVENLEWVSYKENHWHARKTGLLTEIGQHNNKPVRCAETGQEFASCVLAAEWLLSINCPRIRSSKDVRVIARNVRRAARGGTPKAYGYHWENVC